MRGIVGVLAGLSWIAGVLLVGASILTDTNTIQAGYHLQLAMALFLCGIFLLLYQERDSE